MSDETTTAKTPAEPTPIETPVTTEVPNAADVSAEEFKADDEKRKPKNVESHKS